MKSPCKRPFHLCLFSLMSLIFTHPAQAQTPEYYDMGNTIIAIPIGCQSEDLRRTLLLPEFGQNMTSVEDRLGP